MATLFGIIVSAVATLLVGLYFHKRGLKRKLTAHIYSTGHVLTIDYSIRDLVKAFCGDDSINDVFRIRLLIVNDGERGIVFQEPLTLPILKKPKLLDTRILYENENKDHRTFIQTAANGNRNLEFKLRVLNRDWFFYLDLFFDEFIDPKNLEFKLLAEDLPDSIRPVYSSLFPIEGEKPSRWLWWTGIGVSTLVLSASLFSLLEAFFQPLNLFALDTWRAWLVLSLPGFFLALSLFCFLVPIIEAVQTSRKRKKYSLPVHLRE